MFFSFVKNILKCFKSCSFSRAKRYTTTTIDITDNKSFGRASTSTVQPIIIIENVKTQVQNETIEMEGVTFYLVDFLESMNVTR